MTQDYPHPITPPPVLVQQWVGLLPQGSMKAFTVAAQWGADQQLAKDAEWLDHNALNEPHLRITPMGESLKKAMRPKPLTVKEQAIAVLEDAGVNAAHYNILLRGLEQLND
jgi:hypothetical protein